jgi:hypothetical protein
MFEVFAVALTSAALYGWLALWVSRIAALHLIAVWIYFAGLPTVSALLNRDAVLTDWLSTYWYVLFVYGFAVLICSLFFRDRELYAAFTKRLSNFAVPYYYLYVFFVLVLIDLIIRLWFGILTNGTVSTEALNEMPYWMSAIFYSLTGLVFGFFCYASLLSSNSKLALISCIMFISYSLVTEGRRQFFVALLVFFLLRARHLNVKINFRNAALVVGGLFLFLTVTPFFLEARNNIQTLQGFYGENPASAFAEGVSMAASSYASGEMSVIDETTQNLAARGNSGIFFFTIASRLPQFQEGAMTLNSFRWAIPAIFSEKPDLPVEGELQVRSGLPESDDAVSVLIVLYADFGVFGLFAAAMITCLFLYGAVSYLARNPLDNVTSVYLLGMFFLIALRIESEPAQFLIALRDLTLVVAVVMLYRLIFNRRLGQGAGRPQGSMTH